MKRGKFLSHLTAIAVMAVWGATFVSTKVLLAHGLAPSWIFFIRFSIAYLGMWVLCLRNPVKEQGNVNRLALFPGGVRHELVFLLLGISGGSLYFLTENNALQYTQACNVSFIVSSAPLFVTILTILVRRLFHNSFAQSLEDVRFSLTLVLGTVLAFGGMALILFDGHLSLSFRGDILSLGAALCWATYSLFMSSMTARYGALLSTRKVFFYGLLTILPVLLFGHVPVPSLAVLTDAPVLWNLLFLGLIASLVCFVGWNWAMHGLGNVTTTNYVYSNPLFTLVAAVLILGESMSARSALGSAFILVGVVLAGIRNNK